MTTKIEHIQRVTKSGLIDEMKDAMKSLTDGGFKITHSGAYTDKKLWPMVDPERYLIIAERVEEEVS